MKKVIYVGKKDISLKLQGQHLDGLANKFFLEFKTIAISELPVVYVSGNSYKYDQKIGNNNVKQIYDFLSRMAKQEIQEKYGNLGISGSVNIGLNGNTKQDEFSKAMKSLVLSIGKNLGPYYSTAALRGLSVPKDFNDMEQKRLARTQILDALLGKDAQIKAANSDYSWLNNSPALDKVVEYMMTDKVSLAMVRLGDIAEQGVKASVENSVIEGIKGIEIRGAQKDEVTFSPEIERQGKQTIKATGTIDALLDVKLGDHGATQFGISIKLAADPFRIKYKTMTGQKGDTITDLAHWTNSARMFAYWSGSQPQGSDPFDAHLILAASLASLGVGGLSPLQKDRALLTLTMSGYGTKGEGLRIGAKDAKVTLKSLDVVLKEMEKSSRMRMEEIKIIRDEKVKSFLKQQKIESATQAYQSAFDSNVEGLRAGIFGGDRYNSEMYRDWNKKRSFLINFVLKTKKNG